MLNGNDVHAAILGLAQKQAVQPPKINLQAAPTPSLAQPIQTLNIAQPAKTLTIGQPIQTLNIAQPAKTLTIGQPVQTLTIGQPIQTLNIAQPIQTLSIGQPLQTLTIGQPIQGLSINQLGPTADAYKKYDHRTHVYMKPDTYIGADEKMIREEWLFDRQNLKMINTTIDFVPGCERLFLEVLTNASDNVGRSRRAGIDPGKIEITMNNSTITVINHGLPIPVEMHPEEKVYVPQMIFGSLLTSSNYTQDRHEAGTNGIGAKAANIFSKEFIVIVKDHIRNLKYTQTWLENMTICNEPIIEPYTGTTSSVQITYKMDFARFKYPIPQEAPPTISLMLSPKLTLNTVAPTLTLNTVAPTLNINTGALTLNTGAPTLTLNTGAQNNESKTAPITLTIGGVKPTAPTVKGIKGVPDVVEAKNGGYTAEAFALFARHAIDISFTAKTTVTFNGQEFNFSCIRDYARLYFGDSVDTAILHYQWPHGTEIVNKKRGRQVAKNPCIMPEIELIAIDTPDEGHHVSFVNCMMTRDGGVHVNAAVKAVGDSAVKMINDSMLKKLTKQNKGKELDAKEKRSHTITINDVKPHISILLNAKVTNPKFTSQTKTVLHSPTPKIDVPNEELKNIGKWQLIERLYAALDAKQFASLTKNDGKLRKRVKLMKGIDANEAGHAKRHECVLYITEGDSGAGYANRLMTLVPGGRDFIGVLPMRGKSLNVMNADRLQIENNNEINELKKMLGLCEGFDYTEPGNFAKLRYGCIMIMADSDVDGKHIIGLILNFFFCRFPSLLKRNYVMYYRTPTIRVKHGRTILKFYTEQEYEDWKHRTANFMDWNHKYYKGLGTSNKDEVKDDFNNPRVVTCQYDDQASNSMNLAFAKKLTDKRKDWIEAHRPLLIPDDDKMQDISKFINQELILFSLANIERSIPKIDGFKESLRKIIYAAHLKWKIGSKKKTYTNIKVAQFGAFVAEKTSYQHGETILGDVIVGMSQNFVGANNIPWFTEDGQFGCFDPSTPILTWNGSIKAAQDITTNDILIGDDGTPRHISKIVGNTDKMYKISQDYGEEYIVNSQHILTLNMPEHKKIYWTESSKSWTILYFDTDQQNIKEKSFTDNKELLLDFAKTIPDNSIFDINLQTYLSYSDNTKNMFKGVRNLTPIQWPKKEVPIDPYKLGISIANILKIGKEEYQIPKDYILNDVKTRSQFLAGLTESTNTFEQKLETHNQIIEDISFIARSLGYETKISNKVLTINDNIGKYIGSNINVEYKGYGKYVGWHIDSNERFLLGDFTVAHNTRYQNGNDASATRYLFTQPTKLTSLILRKEDRPILKHIIDEGEKVEPENYYPVIPMILVNGSSGIATGYSSFVPCHNPLDIIMWYQLKLRGDTDENDLPTILPWYRGFTGTIKVIDRRNKKKRSNGKVDITIINNVSKDGVIVPEILNIEKEDEVFDENEEKLSTEKEEDVENKTSEDEPKQSVITNKFRREESNNKRPLLSMITIGKFRVDSKGVIIITELPVGRCAYDYHKWLEALAEEKKITDFRDLSGGGEDGNGIYFEIYGFIGDITERTLKLQRSMGMSNMVLLNEINKPVRYDTTKDILETYYHIRLPIYQKRKDYILKHIAEEITTLNYRVQFVQAILDGVIVVINNKVANVRAKMDELGIPREIYDLSKTKHLSEDDIKEFHQLIANKERERDQILNTPITETWLNELNELETAYRSEYGFKKPVIGEDGSVVLTIKPTVYLPPPPITSTMKKTRKPRKAPAPKVESATIPVPVLEAPIPQTISLKVIV